MVLSQARVLLFGMEADKTRGEDRWRWLSNELAGVLELQQPTMSMRDG
jgi:hypothetical protein